MMTPNQAASVLETVGIKPKWRGKVIVPDETFDIGYGWCLTLTESSLVYHDRDVDGSEIPHGD